ncbi:MAG: hypothetical protein ABI361_13655 [Nitrososphaera sp.]
MSKQNTAADEISAYFEKAKAALKSERDSMVQEIKDGISSSKTKALSKA